MRSVTTLSILLCLTAPAAMAHHTYVTKYDSAKKVTLSGTVTSVSYINPHISFGLATGNGSWTVETESISIARSSGVTEAILAEGAKATVTGWPARGGGAELGLATIKIGGKTMTLRRTAR